MVSKVIRASVLGAAASVMAAATVFLKRRKVSTSRSMKPNFDQEKFLNKKIETFDEMTMVVGKDMVADCFAMSFNDIDLESIGSSSAQEGQDVEDNDFEEVTRQIENSSSRPSSSKSRSHRKRSRGNADSSIEFLAGQIGEMANAIKKLSNDNKVNTQNLYKEVMKIEGFDEEFLGSVFDHLNDNNSLVQGFMIKSHNLRIKWIEKFKAKEWQRILISLFWRVVIFPFL